MKTTFKTVGIGAVVVFSLMSASTVLATDELDFGSFLTFANYPPVGFQAGGGFIYPSSSLGGLLASGSVVIGGGLGGGPFSLGTITTSGGLSEAPLTGTSHIQISDFTFAGTLNGTVSFTEIQQTLGTSGYNYLVVGTITGLSLDGSDPGLLTLEGQGTLSLTLTMSDAPLDLSSLVTAVDAGGTVGLNGFSGAINGAPGAMVPETPSSFSLLAGAVLSIGCLARRIRQSTFDASQSLRG